MAELAPAGDRHAVPRVVAVLSSVLERVSERNDDDPSSAPKRSAFRGVSRPAISVRSYLERIFRYANCSPSCYVVAFVYLDRFASRHPSVPIDSFSVHRLLITSILTAVKFMDDIYYNNTYFAKVGGISLMEMNYMEVDFLFGVGFELNVTPAAFASYCSALQSETYLVRPPASAARTLFSLSLSSSEEEEEKCSVPIDW
ncbi:cyclin-P4-1 [Iris pallida]|uniref:Cyclin n=1 Tax=Iris pallida TaxID=29817 RepID=A0AAX6F9S4_IRIPA|nr:cyclin-P4-1 [Iris pallida]KAJ6812685.1 cyclin-P4-1 [Iris pallida]